MMRLSEEKRRDRLLLLGGGAALLLAMALHLAVNVNVAPYSDDYWYGTFFHDGLEGFVRNTRSHYQNTNGRVLIHILVPLLLLADTRIFALISPPLTALIFLLGLRAQDRRLGGGTLLLAAGLGLLSVLGSEIQYLRMTMYWLAAYFNYAFPLLFPLAVLRGMEREEERRLTPLGVVGVGVCSVLAGASTEQCGAVALVLTGGYWLLRAGRRGPSGKRMLLYPLLTAAGYCTILTAPGSHARIDRGIDGGLLSVLDPAVFTARFFDVMDYLCGCPYWNVLFAVFCLLCALACLGDRGLPRHLLSGLPAAALVLALAASGREAPLAVFTVLYTLYAAVTFLFCAEYQVTGLLLLGAGASVMLLIVTTLYYARTFFPCLLLLLTVCWSLLFRALRRQRPGVSAAALAVLAAVCFARYVPIYRGYAANKAVIDQNLRAIETYQAGERLPLCIDLDADYRFTTFFEGEYFLRNYLQYYGLPADTPVRFTSERWDVSDVRVGTRQSVFPALEKDGELLMPIEFIFQASGHTCNFHWDDHTFSITYGGESYTLREDGCLVRLLPEGGEEPVDGDCAPRMPFSYTYTLLYLPAEDLERCFGITFAYDGASDCYIFRGETA